MTQSARHVPSPCLCVLGDLTLRDGDRTIDLGRAQPAVVLAALLCAAPRPVSVDELVEAVWGSGAPPTAATMVHGAVARLRSVLEPDRGRGSGSFVVARGGRYLLDGVRTDSALFEALLEQGRGLIASEPSVAEHLLAEALGWWRGPAYTGLDRPFVLDEVARLEELRLQCIELHATACIALGRSAAAVVALEPIVATHPTRERAAGELIRALCAADRRAEALAVFRRAGRALDEEFGLEPGPVLALALAACTARGDAGPDRRPLGIVGPPRPIGSFLGRQQDLDRIDELLRAHRLVTLTGPGGAGKTRLAVEVAGGRRGDVVFIDLSRAPSAARFEVTMAEAMGVGLDGGPVVERVTTALLGSSVLVVLDNCEHVLDACAGFAHQLLERAPDVRLLATSRERLGLLGERVHPVAPLPVSRPGTPWQQIVRDPAVELFVDRAQAAHHGFRITEQNAGLIAEVCRRLDGLPLALELAAARTASMSLRDLLDGFEDRLGLLDGAGRAAAERHRGLRSAIAWSADLLPHADRRLFTQLAVFPATFDLHAVRAVTDAGGVDPALSLARLVDCSLVQVDDHAGATWRYRLLETTRAFARATVSGSAAEPLAWRHASHYLELARDAAPHLQRTGAVRWLARLHLERDNLRAALDWAAGPDGDPAMLIGFGESLWHYWDLHGSRAEGIRWLTAGLAALDTGRPERRTLLSALSLMHLGRGEFDATELAADELLHLARAAGDRRWEGNALAMHATVAWAHGRYDRARHLYEDAIAASLAGCDLWRASLEEAQLARLHRDRAEPEAARALAARAAAHADDVGEELARGLARDVLASIEHRWGDNTAARDLIGEALAHYRVVDYREGEASAEHLSGLIALADSDATTARECIRRSLAIYRRIGHRAGVAAALENLAGIEADHAHARSIRSRAAAIRSQLEAPDAALADD